MQGFGANIASPTDHIWFPETSGFSQSWNLCWKGGDKKEHEDGNPEKKNFADYFQNSKGILR